MTEDDLRAIEARAQAATHGPWHWGELNDTVGLLGYPPNEPAPVHVVEGIWRNDSSADAGCDLPADAEFIAHARQDVPALIREIRLLRFEAGLRHNECPSCGVTLRLVEGWDEPKTVTP